MSFALNFLKFSLTVIIFVASGKISTVAQSNNLLPESILEIENQARELEKQWNAEAYRRAIEVYTSAFVNWQKLNKGKNAVNCLLEISRLQSLLGDYRTALQTLYNALSLMRNSNYKPEKLKARSLISTISLKTGNMSQSRKNLEESLAELENFNPPEIRAAVFFSAGEFYYEKGEFEKSLDYYQKTLDLWRQIGDKFAQGEVLVKIAYAYMSMSEMLKGLEAAKEAEKIFLELNSRRGLAISRIAIGHLSVTVSESQTALESYLKAAEDFPDDVDLIEKARLFNGIGAVYEDYGEWQLSLENRLKALNLFNMTNYVFGQLATLQSLIKLNYLLGNTESAEKYFSEIQILSEKLNDKYYLAITFLYVGDYHFKNSQHRKAIFYYRKSLETFQKIPSRYWIAVSLNKLGDAYLLEGRFKQAENFYQSSLQISRRIMSRLDESESLYKLGTLKKLQAENEAAYQNLRDSILITESLSSNLANARLRRTYLSNVADRYELYINLLMQKHRNNPNANYALEALQAAEKARARGMLENLLLSQADFAKDASPELIKREKEIRNLLNLKTDKLTELLSRDTEKSEIKKLDDEINELNHQLENIKAELKQKSPIYSAIKNPPPFELSEFQQKVLDENSLFLEFSFGAEESYLWLIGKNEFHSYVLPPRELIEAKIQTLRELLVEREMKPDETIENYQIRIQQTDANYWMNARQLSRDLFGQLADKLANKRLIIAPDGKLHYFPISALPLPDSQKNEPLLLTNEVIYEPSGQMLLTLLKMRNQASENPGKLLVFADPVFSRNDSRIAMGNSDAEQSAAIKGSRSDDSPDKLPRLEGSQKEGEIIEKIFGASQADIFSGFLATRENVMRPEISAYRIIHFATHGVLNEERPELSGIVLSGFNEKGQKIHQFIRLQDIYELDLNAELVVLSACNTGIGKEVKGEGLQSLNNAFLSVGTKTVISSLWKVEDMATLELMKNFYSALSEGNKTSSQALREAQTKMWENPRYQSPFYWASFMVQGDFMSVPMISAKSDIKIYTITISALLLVSCLIWQILRRRSLFSRRNRKN